MPRSWTRPLLLAVAGIALLQSSYILALPPFRGADEFDHAFRASGVADGQVRLDEPAIDGRGEVVYVPAALVEAAAPQCKALPYSQPANCRSGAERSDGRVAVATAAGSYHPAYYWTVGTAGAAFEATTSLYAMRIASGLLCLGLVVIGLLGLASGRRDALVWLGALAGLTPTFAYSSIVVAPNGIEMAAGFAAWGMVLSLFAAPSRIPRRLESWFIALATLACVVLVTVRTLGPVWLLLIVLCVSALVGPREVLARIRARPVAFALAIGATGLAALAGLAWSMSSGLASGSAPASDIVSDKGPIVAFRWPLWTLQAIASAPLKDDSAPAVVYALVLVVVMGVVGAGIRRGSRRARFAVLLACLLALAVPTGLVLATYQSQGGVWQGRYALPFLCGLPVLAAWCAPAGLASSVGSTARRWWLIGGVVCLAAAHAMTSVSLQASELQRAASAEDDTWLRLPLVVTAGLAVLGVLVAGLAMSRIPRTGPPPAGDTVGQLAGRGLRDAGA